MVDYCCMSYYCTPSVRLLIKEPREWEFHFGMESGNYVTENAKGGLTLQPCNFAERGCRRRFFSSYFCRILQKSFFVDQLWATACDTMLTRELHEKLQVRPS